VAAARAFLRTGLVLLPAVDRRQGDPQPAPCSKGVAFGNDLLIPQASVLIFQQDGFFGRVHAGRATERRPAVGDPGLPLRAAALMFLRLGMHAGSEDVHKHAATLQR
jgi:hypothetical protein